MKNSAMNRKEKNSDSIPIDLIVEIFSRLPAKSIARFHCLWKLWGSILHRQYFTELFLTRSWARPRLLFALTKDDEWSFYSSLQPHNPYDRSASLLIANSAFHMKFPGEMCPEFHDFASGLIHFSKMRISKKSEDIVSVICNPRTGQYASLPKHIRYRKSCSFLGFDPVGKQIKVLFKAYRSNDHKILTLRTGGVRSRKIQCPLTYKPCSDGMCINGVLYYLGKVTDGSFVMVCFDVRSENFKFIDAPNPSTHLINYKGNVGWIRWDHDEADAIELRMWVLDDVEKQKWSNYVYTLPEKAPVDLFNHFIAGVTALGEIVLSETHTSERFYVFYFSPERNTLQRVQIQGLENHSRVHAYVDHVEDLNVNYLKQLKSSPRLKIIRDRPIPSKPSKPQKRDICNSGPSVKNKQPTSSLQNKFELLAKLE